MIRTSDKISSQETICHRWSKLASCGRIFGNCIRSLRESARIQRRKVLHISRWAKSRLLLFCLDIDPVASCDLLNIRRCPAIFRRVCEVRRQVDARRLLYRLYDFGGWGTPGSRCRVQFWFTDVYIFAFLFIFLLNAPTDILIQIDTNFLENSRIALSKFSHL